VPSLSRIEGRVCLTTFMEDAVANPFTTAYYLQLCLSRFSGGEFAFCFLDWRIFFRSR
jgi:hypothetical protein